MGFYNLKIINSGDERVEVYYSKDYKIKTGEVKKKRNEGHRSRVMLLCLIRKRLD